MQRSSDARKHEVKDEKSSAVSLINSIRDMFIFSQFGLRCGKCNKGAMILFDERSIRIHLKKHGMNDRVATVRSFFNLLKIHVDSAKALGTIEPYQSDRETYIGYLCICGQVFQSRKDSAL
jgi:hypothetical protein